MRRVSPSFVIAIFTQEDEIDDWYRMRGKTIQKRRPEYPASYNLQRLSVRPGMECIPGTDTETESASWCFSICRRRCQVKVHAAMMAIWATRKIVPAMMASPRLMHMPIVDDMSSLSMKTVSLVAEAFDNLPSRSKPNLSVIWIDCTKRRSSRLWEAAAVERRRRRLPKEITERNSPVVSSWSHCTGSQAGIHGVTRARNCTTSELGNLKASKCDSSICNGSTERRNDKWFKNLLSKI